MRRYGKWAGETAGYRERETLCVVQVADVWGVRQCCRKRGHGPDGLYCKQHAKMLADGKRVYVPEDETCPTYSPNSRRPAAPPNREREALLDIARKAQSYAEQAEARESAAWRQILSIALEALK